MTDFILNFKLPKFKHHLKFAEFPPGWGIEIFIYLIIYLSIFTIIYYPILRNTSVLLYLVYYIF